LSGLVIQANVRQIASDTARHEGQFHASAWHAGCSFKSLVAGCRSGPASTRRAPPPLLVLNTRATSNAQQNQWHGQKAARKGWEQEHATGFRVPSQSPAVTGDGCNEFRIGGDGGRGSAAGRFTFVGETTGLVDGATHKAQRGKCNPNRPPSDPRDPDDPAGAPQRAYLLQEPTWTSGATSNPSVAPGAASRLQTLTQTTCRLASWGAGVWM